MPVDTQSTPPTFDQQRHARYFSHSLKSLPEPYAHLDTNRLTLVHFAVHSLDLIGVLDDGETLEKVDINKENIVDWIYSLQVLPSAGDDSKWADHGGFKGGTFLGGSGAQYKIGTATVGNDDGDDDKHNRSYERLPYQVFEYDHGHVAMTYTALCTLAALGDDLSRFDREGAVKLLKQLQQEDGSFQCISVGSENDMRFLFCACAISHMLNDWSGVNVDTAIKFIKSCRSYDGAISLIPGQEGHGGSTFCAVSALTLMGKAEEVLSDAGWRDDLLQWCTSRQIGGMQGRPNKVEDTCYSYWIGGTLRLLGCSDDLLDKDALTGFVLSCQTDMGGFSKVQGAYPDLLHSFYSMAWLSMSKGQGLNELNCTLGMRQSRTSVFELSC